MSVRSIESLQRYLRQLCAQAEPSEDAVLLRRFVAANDREAFELLIARHGPMVLGTARRLVDNSHDAEDVFQAVFLSLARLAKTIRQGRALPAWLHKTTCRVAAKVRKQRIAGVGERLAEPCENVGPDAQLVWQEVRQALDEELQQLPERWRSPLLLCYLSGLTRDEAARQLGWSLGTLKRRLEEGRKALRVRLARRGIAAVGLALTVLTPETLQAAVGKSLVDSSLSLIFSKGAVVPATIAALVLSSAATMKGLAMKSILALLVAIAVGAGIYAGMGQADPPQQAAGKKQELPAQKEKAVQLDEPLPAGSVLRFGTARFRHGIPVSTLAVSADGKLAVAVNGNHMQGATRAFDLVTGRALYTLGGWEGTSIEAAAISPDGRTIVTKQDFSLRIRDAATGKERRKIELQRANSYSRNEWLAFTPDGKAIAVTSQGKVIHLIDFASGKTIRNFPNDNPESNLSGGFSTVLGIAFSPDGKLMASGGFANDKGNYFARLWEVGTGKELRRFMHGMRSYGIPSLAFSPDAKTLATRAHDGSLRLFAVDTGKERKTFPADGGGRRMGSVAFSPDGKTVAAAGDSIRLYDVTTGEERLCIERKQACGLQFTDGGKTLTGAVNGAIYRWDTATGKTLTPAAAGDSVVEQILVTPDGTRVVTRGQNGDAHLWDAATGQHLRHVAAAWQRGVALSPDGRFLVWAVADDSVKYTDPAQPNATYTGSRLKLYDVAADRVVERFAGFKGDAQELAFAPDGKTLVTVDHGNATVRVWDVAAGKERRSFRVARENEKTQPHQVWSASLAPDGATLAVTYQRADNTRSLFAAYAVRLYDVATGSERHELPGHLYYVGAPAFSPDGKLVVTASPALSPFLQQQLKQPANQVFVWDVATGKRVAGLPNGLPLGAVAAAFSPDGRTVALARGADLGGAAKPADDEGVVYLYEVATWTVRAQFRGDQGRVTALTFAPDGRLLAGGIDTTVLAWDVRPPRVALSVPLESAWNDLAAKEAGNSFRSAGRFLAAPADTVKMFAAKTQPVAALDPKRMQRLLADLDSEEFAVREAATKALDGLDQQARPYLEATLKSAISIEFRTRVQRILQRQQEAALTPEELRQTRAVMVLELIGDGAAKSLLQRWAGGPAGALLTGEASQALKRLGAVAKSNK
jgi:RNA polymerase sigma factor (sigma-70 family)